MHLGLPGLTVIRGRAEEIADVEAHRGAYQVVVARAVAALPKLWQWASPLLSPGGSLIAFKGPGSLSGLAAGVCPRVRMSEKDLGPGWSGRERALVFVSSGSEKALPDRH